MATVCPFEYATLQMIKCGDYFMDDVFVLSICIIKACLQGKCDSLAVFFLKSVCWTLGDNIK